MAKKIKATTSHEKGYIEYTKNILEQWKTQRDEGMDKTSFLKNKIKHAQKELALEEKAIKVADKIIKELEEELERYEV